MGQKQDSDSEREVWADFGRLMYDVQVESPRRARKNAVAWIGTVTTSCFTVEGYTDAHWGSDYAPPSTSIAPAAFKDGGSALHISVKMIKAGNPIGILTRHLTQAREELPEGVTITIVANEEHNECIDLVYSHDMVYISWTKLGSIFPAPGYKTPKLWAMLLPDGTEYSADTLSETLIAAFPTKQEAEDWTKRRKEELITKYEHSRDRLRKEPSKRRRVRRSKK